MIFHELVQECSPPAMYLLKVETIEGISFTRSVMRQGCCRPPSARVSLDNAFQ